MDIPKPVQARLMISGTFEYRDKNGNVLKTFDLSGSIPLSDEPGVPPTQTPPIAATISEQTDDHQRSE